jgi:hypothetical protein
VEVAGQYIHEEQLQVLIHVETYSSFGSGDQRPRVNELGHVLVGRAEVSINSTDIARCLSWGRRERLNVS